MYTSADNRERHAQWEYIKQRKHQWDKRWIVRRDFSDIRNHKEKIGERRREESSFVKTIEKMGMGEV